MEIDETKLPESLFVTDDKGNKVIDYSRIKTIDDVEIMKRSKDHVNDEIKALKEKFNGVDIEKYQSFIKNEIELNKDILSNPVYKSLETKYSTLNSQYNELQKTVADKDAKIFEDSLRSEIIKHNEIQSTAVDDVLYRLKQAGFSMTEKGILSKDGLTIDDFIEGLKDKSGHLFKRTIGINESERAKNLNQATINNSLRDALSNCPRVKK